MTRPHGYARYRLDGCRCYVCGFASSEYNQRREARIRVGTWQPYVDTCPARQHIARLSALGYGDRSIAALAGLTRKSVRDLRSGTRHDPVRGNPPLTRVRTETAAAILAIPLAQDQLPDGALVDAEQTWTLIDALVRRGWSKAKIAREAGLGRTVHLGRSAVTARNARRIEALHERATRRGVDVDELNLLIGTDTSENIARRLGYADRKSLERVLYRAGQFALARRLSV